MHKHSWNGGSQALQESNLTVQQPCKALIHYETDPLETEDMFDCMTNLVLAKKKQKVFNTNETGTSLVGNHFDVIQLVQTKAHIKHVGQLKQITFNPFLAG